MVSWDRVEHNCGDSEGWISKNRLSAKINLTKRGIVNESRIRAIRREIGRFGSEFGLEGKSNAPYGKSRSGAGNAEPAGSREH